MTLSIQNRRGGSKTEIIIAVVCLAVIVAVAVPLIHSARSVSRQHTCLHHVAELTKAAVAAAEIDGNRLPPLDNGHVGWPALLLVQLRLPHVAEQILDDPEAADGMNVSVFACPFDLDSFNRPGGLSYVGNSGYGLFEANAAAGTISARGPHSPEIDLDGDGDVSPEEILINRATGVFWPETDAGPRMTLEFVRDHDGLASTMLITENLDAGTWTSRDTLDIAFVIGRDTLGVEANAVGPRALALPEQLDLGLFAPHADPARPPGRSPVPGSLHSGTIHVGFCDGRARPVSVKIDPHVYARLMTPAGTSYGQGQPPAE